MKSHQFIDSPVGRILLVVERGALTAVYHEDHSPPPVPAQVGVPFASLAGGQKEGSGAVGMASAPSLAADGATFDRALEQFRSYFAGNRRVFSLPVHPWGTDFQQLVWAAVLKIPYGETLSYKEVAAELGNQAMGRAVGAAIRANPLAIIIPGHRVVSSSGKVTGYSAGLGVKAFLLDLEAGHSVLPAA